MDDHDGDQDWQDWQEDAPEAVSSPTSTERVRILGAERAGGALESPAPGSTVLPEAGEDRPPAGGRFAPELPHWTDPPTGQVPAVLARDDDTAVDTGPVWREREHEWDQEFEPASLADDETRVGVLGETSVEERRPWEFQDLTDPSGTTPVVASSAELGGEHAGLAPGDDDRWDERWEAWERADAAATPGEPAPATATAGPEPGADDDAPTDAVTTISSSPLRVSALPSPSAVPGARPRGRRRRGEPALVAPEADTGGAPAEEVERRGREFTAHGAPRHDSGGDRDLGAAIVVGVVVAAVALGLMKLGPAPTLVLVAVIVTLAAAEVFAALRRAGRRPATLLGLVATLALVLTAYAKGVAAIPLVLALLVAATFIWFLAEVEPGRPTQGVAYTLLGFCWVGVLGAYAALLLAPSQFPERHGVAFFFGAVAATVFDDIGALVVGRSFGRHPLAPRVSPNKTWEGVIGGGIIAIVGSALITGHMHPWTPAKAALLGLVVAVVAPLGDLCESLVKRDLGVKDMGSLLPGHGGVLDRFDAMLFVLPATYYLVRVVHLG